MSDSFLKTQVIDKKNESELCKVASTGAVPKVPKKRNSNEGKLSKLETKITNKPLSESSSLKRSDESKTSLKMSPDSLDRLSSRGTPKRAKKPLLNFPDTDSCLSVSSSPDPDTKKKTFDFSMIDPSDKSSLTAALQTEQEFLDFMFSLPQIQKEAIDKDSKEKVPKKVTIKSHEVKNVKTEKKAPNKGAHSIRSGSGFDQLDNLCRMMEQLGELKEQNTRLQRRVLYLEELKTLQEMHRDIQDSIASRKSALSLGSVSLSDSDLRLEDLTKYGYLLDSEESLDKNVSVAKNKDQTLELPDTTIALQRHSSSEDDRRGKEDTRRTSEKEKKGHKSAWGKVKHMISYNTKRENVRKKSTAGVENAQPKRNTSISKSLSTQSAKNPSGGHADGTGVSDPEEYDLEYESNDPDGTSWDWDEAETGGIWMGPKTPPNVPGHADVSGSSLTGENIRAIKRNKPQLTITVPSNENIHNATRTANTKLSAEMKCSPGSSPSKFDMKSSPEFSTSPPSPRRSSNWSKVKNAFLTGPIVNHHNHNSLNADQELQTGNRNRSHQSPAKRQFSPQRALSSQPPSPHKKTQLQTNFSFDVTCTQEESDSPSGISPEISPDDILLPNRHRHSKDRRRVDTSPRHSSIPSSVVHKNLIDLQRTLTGEFNKKLQEWEKLKSQQGIYGSGSGSGATTDNRGIDIFRASQPGGDLPEDFKKKLDEWEKMKGREFKEKIGRSNDTPRIHVNAPLLHLYHHNNHHNHNHHHQNIGHEDLKTKIHDEDDLPPDFKKKLAEWEIRKALVGKGQQNVEQLQKNLGEEFNKKLAEWEKMKASSQGKITSQSHESSVPVTTESSSDNHIPRRENHLPNIRLRERTSTDESTLIGLRENLSAGSRSSYTPAGSSGYGSQSLDRKGSGHKIKKTKSGKIEKAPMTKAESQKHRDKELLWLEKELHKIDREKQRLEREKEKFLEREARLEKMRHAMRQGPAEKKEIYIKTSTGEFRFEGISQTFTKKLYEWEERRGIRPESSTFVLLDPNYKAPEKEKKETSMKNSPESKRITRSRSESSVVEMSQTSGTQATVSHQSSISLNDMDKEDSSLQNDNKATSEPTLISAGEEVETPKCAVLVQMEEEIIEECDSHEVEKETERVVGPDYQDPYAPAEITRLIDSSGSEDNMKSQNDVEDDVTVVSNDGIIMTTPVTFVAADEEALRPGDSQRSEESYRSLLHENMTLLGKLKEQESLCRALETQMGDIDTRMDNVADQHLKTLEKLHRQVSIMKKSETSSMTSNNEVEGNSSDDVESNERLITQLKTRIVELELKGDKLMEEKEELERAFKLHKSHETEIAESLLIRIRELQDAGAEVNIQTVKSQMDNTSNIIPTGSEENVNDHSSVTCHEDEETETNDASVQTATTTTSTTENPLHSSPSTASDATSQTTASLSIEPTNSLKKKRRKRRDEYCNSSDEDESEDENNETDEEEEEKRRGEKEGKEHQKRKRKLPPKKVQKLHSLTADLLFQAKRLEGALISRHNLPHSFPDQGEIPPSKQPKRKGLKGRSSLRLTGEEDKIHIQRKPSKGANANRAWSSIEAITSPDQEAEGDGLSSYESRAAALASESQDLLAMNAELSRMAKELRKEMLSVWSFRESTSPESNSSDTREETIKSKAKINDEDPKFEYGIQPEDEKDNHNEWLNVEAREIFESIASLQPANSDLSESLQNEENDDKDEEDSIEGEKRPETFADSEKEDSVKEHETESVDAAEIQESVVELEEHFQSWWDVPYPKKRKNFAQQSRKSHSVDVPETNEEGLEQSSDLDSVIPGSSGTRISDLLRMEKEKEDKNFIEDKETLNIRLSPYYNINSPRISRASSSTSDDDRKDVTGKCFFNAEKEDSESANGTLNTICSSTVKSDILSSSFEYETRDIQAKSQDEHESSDDFYKEQYEKFHEIHTPPKSNTDFTPCQLSKVQEIINETRMKIESEELKSQEKYIEECVGESPTDDEEKKYETEVKSGFKTEGKIGGLRTRRVSDSQIYYMESQVGLLDEPHGYQNDKEYTDKPCKPATRTPSIRRNQSESDVLWLKEHQNVNNTENDPSLDIFVPTHRTIFTVTGTNDSFATEVIPTFLPDEDDDACEGTEKSLEYTDKNLSCETLKEDMSLSNDVDSENSETCESKSKSNYVIENEDFEAEESGTQTKRLNEESNLSTSSRSITPFRSPPVSPSFISAFCSSFHQNSPPVRSKKKVLEAANETSPTVKTMIDLYNKRITEKQEMLINPFKPGDPFTEKKYSNLSVFNKNNSSDETELAKGRILKSQSTSILPTHSAHKYWNIQRSISGTNEVMHSSKFYEFESGLPRKTSSPVSFNNSYINSHGNNVSSDLDASTENSLDTCSRSRVSSSNLNAENEKTRSRASILRKARNEFLSRGAAPLTFANRLRDNYEDFSDGIKIDNLQSNRKGSNSSSNNMSSSKVDSISDNAVCKDLLNVELRALPISRKESFRRQSESCLLDEFTIKSEVLKSASTGGIEYRKKEVQGRPPSSKENRKSSYDPADDKRSPKGIFKLFKKSKTRDRKDLSTVQELCKQSLAAVEITSPSRISNTSSLEQPSTSQSNNPEDLTKMPERIRTSKTLPREEAPNEASASTSRSCPSSPEALRKSKTPQWLSVGKNIFKSRSSSPSKRPR